MPVNCVMCIFMYLSLDPNLAGKGGGVGGKMNDNMNLQTF